MNLKRAIAVIAIPLILINCLTAVYYYKTVSLESRISSNQVFLTTTSIVENIYNEAEGVYCMLIAESGLDIFMSTDSMPDLEPVRQRATKNMMTLASTHCALSDVIESIDIYSYSAGYVLSTYHPGNIQTFSDKPWSTASSDQLCFSLPCGDSFSICYNVLIGKEKRGLIIFNINPGEIKNVFADTAAKHYTAQLMDQNKNVFFATDTPSHFSPDFSEDNDAKPILKNKYAEMTLRIDDVYLYMVIEHAQPIYLNFILMALLLIVVILFISLIMALLLSLYSYRTVNDIIMNINDIGTDDRYEDSVNEIMYINQNILNMKNKNQQLEQELVKSFATLKTLQTQVLQIQFTPHFLFNALNALNLSLMLNHGIDNPNSESILILSELLSASIDIKHYMVTVGQEVEYCEKYVKIQSLISNSRFDVTWDIDDAAKPCIAVKFILQPLIENAFKHGIKYLKNKTRGALVVSAKRQENRLIFKIFNNGPAPDEIHLKQLNEALAAAVNFDENHVGLFNVNKRIKLIFGDEYGCRIYVQDSMTVAEVITPAITDFLSNKN